MNDADEDFWLLMEFHSAERKKKPETVLKGMDQVTDGTQETERVDHKSFEKEGTPECYYSSTVPIKGELGDGGCQI